MRAHLIHAHPETNSYNGALSQTAVNTLEKKGYMVTKSDLYQQRFDPVEKADFYLHRADETSFAALNEQRHAWHTQNLPADVLTEIKRLEKADVIILQFPLWWHGPPAILKGWMDRVFVNGGLYSSRKRYDAGHFKGKRALVSVTTGAPEAAFGTGCRGGDFETMLWPVHYSLHYMGFSVLPPFISYGVQGHGYSYEDENRLHERLTQNLTDWGLRLTDIESINPLVFPGWDDWDRDGRALPALDLGKSKTI